MRWGDKGNKCGVIFLSERFKRFYPKVFPWVNSKKTIMQDKGLLDGACAPCRLGVFKGLQKKVSQSNNFVCKAVHNEDQF